MLSQVSPRSDSLTSRLSKSPTTVGFSCCK
nr:MAG TPA: hypothetical protein [Caudoviricetes sp.]